MKILYIGQYEYGSTSKMRGDYIQKILSPNHFKVINISVPLLNTSKIYRSIGWRYKIGPLIENVNKYIIQELTGDYSFDLVWVDKGVFVNPLIIEKLAAKSVNVVHFTPDPAFLFHRSKLFINALPIYKICFTTKSFEIQDYHSNGAKNVNFCTQGFDPKIHKPYINDEDKKGVIFIGHMEPERENVVAKILDRKIQITLAGVGWKKFSNKHRNNSYLNYLGEGIFGHDYGKALSGALAGLGFLSKIIPELHTTRTIEIPACRTALISEKTSETQSILSDNEAVWVDNVDDWVFKIENTLNNPRVALEVARSGYEKIMNGGYDYESIVKSMLTLTLNTK